MNSTQWLWIIIALSFVSVVGILFTFFPGKVIRFFARIQYAIFKNIGMEDQDIDRLPLYSSLYREDYSKRLKSEIETPEKHKFLMFWARIPGCLLLFFTFLAICILLQAVRTGYL